MIILKEPQNDNFEGTNNTVFCLIDTLAYTGKSLLKYQPKLLCVVPGVRIRLLQALLVISVAYFGSRVRQDWNVVKGN